MANLRSTLDASLWARRCAEPCRIELAPSERIAVLFIARRWILAILVLLPLLLIPSSLHGQVSVTSTISGTVKDPNDYVIPGAEVTVVDQESQVTHSAKTDNSGQFHFSELNASTYTVTVKEKGFTSYSKVGIVVASSVTVELPTIILKLGDNNVTVTVSSDQNALNTTDPNDVKTVKDEMLTEIAQRSHDISDILAMLPGVETATPGGVDIPNRNAIGQLTVNGVSAAGSTMNITVDGNSTNLSGVGGYMNVVPTADMVKEIKVTSSNYRADTGMQSGPTISIVTKNGGKLYHGTAEFPYRDKIFNANLPDNKKIFPQTVRPNNLLLIPSATFSGPLYIPHLIPKRADLFFFVGARYQRSSTAAVQQDTLPTAAERSGDFSNTVNANGNRIYIVDPTASSQNAVCGYSGQGGSTTFYPAGTASVPGGYYPVISRDGTANTCNQIPESRIDLNGQKVLNLFPLPNFISSSGCTGGTSPCGANYQYNPVTVFTRRTYSANLDWTPQLRHFSISLRYIYDPYTNQSTQNNPGSIHGGVLGDNTVPLGLFAEDSKNQNYTISLRNTLSQTLVNSIQVGATRSHTRTGNVSDILSIAKTGINYPSLYPAANTTGLTPDFLFGGGGIASPPSIQQNYRNPQNDTSLAFNATDNLSKVFRRHVIGVGVLFSLNMVNGDVQSANQRGSYNFTSSSLNGSDTNNPFANALMGIVYEYSQTAFRPRTYSRARFLEYFVQDEWRARGNLTLDYGIRFYQDPNPYEKNDALYGFAPSVYTAAAAPVLVAPFYKNGCNANVVSAVNPVGQNSCSKYNSTLLIGVNPLNANQTFTAGGIGGFVPGVGNVEDGVVKAGTNGVPRSISTRATVILSPRVGFAFTPFNSQNTVIRGGIGLYHNSSAPGPGNGGRVPNFGASTLNYVTSASIAASSGTSLTTPTATSLIAAQLQTAQDVYNYSFGVTREIRKSFVLGINYVGSQGRHLVETKNINPIPIGARLLPQNYDPRTYHQPLPDVYLSKYRDFPSINVSVNTGTSKYNSLQVNMQGNVRRYRLTVIQNYTFARTMATAGVSAYYPAPYREYGSSGRPQLANTNFIYYLPNLGKRFHSLPLSIIADGWELTGNAQYGSANYVTPGYSITGGPQISGSTDAARLVLVNPHAPASQGRYAAPEVGTFGDIGVGTEKGIFYVTSAMGVTRNWVYKERYRMSFRADAFNPLNSQITQSINTSLSFTQPGSTYNNDPTSFTTNELKSSHFQGRTYQFNLRAQF